MEQQALKYSLQLATEHSLMNFEIKTDAANIIDLLESENYNPHNNIIFECRYWMKRLGDPLIHHIYREGNQVAHELAKQASNQANVNYSAIYIQMPESLKDLVLLDSNGITTTTTIRINVDVLNNLALLDIPAPISLAATSLASSSSPSALENSPRRTSFCNDT